MEIYHVLRIDEQLYGCEELPEGQPVCCDVLLEDAAGQPQISGLMLTYFSSSAQYFSSIGPYWILYSH